MRILVTGGGTGGHVLPLRAVASNIKTLQPDAVVGYIGQQGDSFSRLLIGDDNIAETYQIRAGKWRRYHGVPWHKQLLDLKTQALNIRDLFYVIVGFFHALGIMVKFKPDVVFIKGGFVGVPVGFAAALLRKPIITHDSDTVPGLANKLVGRWAKLHAVGAPEKYYQYPKEKMRYTGVPASPDFKPVSIEQQKEFKERLNLDPGRALILVTGGSQGAKIVNDAVLKIAKPLTELGNVIHISGDNHIKAVTDEVMQLFDKSSAHLYEVLPFVNKDFYVYSGAADVIIARSGSSVFEFALQKKALVLIPNPRLTGGHQVANGKMYADAQAAVVINEDDLIENPQLLLEKVKEILSSPAERKHLQDALHALAKPNATKDLAELIINFVQKG